MLRACLALALFVGVATADDKKPADKLAAVQKEHKDAEAAYRKAAEALEAARRTHLQAVKKVEKFQRLVDLEQAAAAAHEQYVEDTAMDEFIRLGLPADP